MGHIENMVSSKKMNKINQLDEYIDALCKISSDVLICIAMKEPQGRVVLDEEKRKIGDIKYLVEKSKYHEFVTEQRLHSMLNMGMLDLRGKADWNYVFAKYNGKIVSNRISEPDGMVHDEINIGTRKLELSSKAFSKGNEVVISVDGSNFSVNHQGMNIVVIDCKGGRLLDSVAFDTSSEECCCYRHPDMFYRIYGFSLDSKNFLNWIGYAEKWLFQDFGLGKTKALLHEINDIVSYLHMLLLIKQKYMIVLSVKDTPGSYMSDEILNLIHSMGFDKLRRDLWRMYIGIAAEGEVLFNEVAGRSEEPVYCDCVNKTQTIKMHVESRAFRNGNEAKICIGEKDYAVNKRGINIVVMNPVDGDVLDSVAFDTQTENYGFYRE